MNLHRGAIFIAAGLVLGGAAAAQAADLGGMKEPAYAPMMAPRPAWYFRIDGGYAIHNDPSMKDNDGFAVFTGEDLENTWTIGGGVGKYFGSNWRGDITVDYHLGATVGPAPTGIFDTDLRSTVVLANLYYDFDRGTAFTPYVGVGVGFVHHRMSATTIVTCGCTLDVDSHSDTDFAAAFMAGFSWNLSRSREVAGSTKDGPIYVESDRGWKLDFGYRLLWLGDAETGRVVDTSGPTTFSSGFKAEDILAHEFRIGLRYDIR